MPDTFAVLSSRRANFKEREGSTFKTWLFKIAKNIALKHLRKRRHVFSEVFDDMMKIRYFLLNFESN